MDANKIMQSDVLDIIFEKRNKLYGAYDLRKTYNKRITFAIITMVSILVFLFGGYLLAGNFGKNDIAKMYVTDTLMLANLKEPQPDIPPPPPLPKADPPRVETRIFTAPKIVPTDVPEDEKPPEQTTLETTKIGNINQEGKADDGFQSPVDGNKDVVSAPKKENKEEDGIFETVEIESSYPGGLEQWARFLNRTFHYPDEAVNKEIGGAVTVQFIVDKEGNVSDVQAVNGPEDGGLREEAVRVIKKSGKWIPAIQNGRPVKSYKRQPIIFKLNDQ